MSRRRDAADAEEAAAAEGSTEEATTAPEPTTGNSLRLLTVGEGDVLTCAVCHNPIESGHGYLQASYGPVHYTDCANRTVRVSR